MAGKRKRSFKSRRTRSKRRRFSRRRRISYMKSPVPQKMFVKMKFSDTFSVNPGAAGTVAEAIYYGTGMWDPRYAVGGAQPRGFDQFVGVLYDHYVVVGAKATCRFDNSGNTVPIICMIKTQDSGQQTTSRADWFEDTYTTKRLCGSGTSARQFTTVTKKFNTGRFLGRSNVLSDSTLKGTNAANPTENVFFHVGVCSVDDSLDINAVPVQIEIEFLAYLIERRNPPIS